MKSRKSEKRKECSTLSGIILRYASVPHMTHDGAVFHPEMYRYKTAWHSIRPPFQLVTLETFQAVKLEAPKGGLGRAQRAGAEAGCRALEDGSGKEGEPKASGAERAGNIGIQLSFESATHKTSGGYWTRSDEFFAYTLLEKLHFHVALEEVRVTELLSY